MVKVCKKVCFEERTDAGTGRKETRVTHVPMPLSIPQSSLASECFRQLQMVSLGLGWLLSWGALLFVGTVNTGRFF